MGASYAEPGLNLVAENSVGTFLASGDLQVRDNAVQDACQLATDDVSGMISVYLQWHRAAAIVSETDRWFILPERAIWVDIGKYLFV